MSTLRSASIVPLLIALLALPSDAGAQAADTAATAATTAATAATVRERGADDHLRDGRWLIEFRLPDVSLDGGGGGAIGFWNMLSPRTSLGADIGFAVRTNERESERDSVTQRTEQTMVSLRFKPGIRRYFETRRSVAAFVEIAVPLSVGGGASSYGYRSNQWQAGFGVSGAIGLNWFITDALSLAGGLGASLEYTSWESEYDDGMSDGTERGDSFSFDMHTGELRLGIWF